PHPPPPRVLAPPQSHPQLDVRIAAHELSLGPPPRFPAVYPLPLVAAPAQPAPRPRRRPRPPRRGRDQHHDRPRAREPLPPAAAGLPPLSEPTPDAAGGPKSRVPVR